MSSITATIGSADTVDMVEALAVIRAGVGSEVLVATAADGASLAVPIRSIIAIPGARIDIGPSAAVLLIPGWTNDSHPFCVVSLVATTFADFIGRATV